MARTVQASRVSCRYWKKRVEKYYRRIKSLQGDPHYVAVAMVAGGVLLGILPAIGTYFLTCYLFGRIRATTRPIPRRCMMPWTAEFNSRIADVQRKAASVM
jgi:hypothetical protein